MKLGNRLHPQVMQLLGRDPTRPDLAGLAGKITGMVLERENSDIHMIIASEEFLKMQIEDAINVLQDVLAALTRPTPADPP